MPSELNRYVLIEVAGTIYGVQSEHVSHVEMLDQITLVPNANPVIDGVVFSRGQVVPALSLRTRFGLPRTELTLRSRMVFVTVDARMVGLVVDSAREFIQIPTETVQPIEENLTGIHGNYLRGVARPNGRLILIIDLGAILDVEQCEPASSSIPRPEPSPAGPVKSPTNLALA